MSSTIIEIIDFCDASTKHQFWNTPPNYFSRLRMSKPKPLPKFALLKDLIENASKHQSASRRLHFHRLEVQIWFCNGRNQIWNIFNSLYQSPKEKEKITCVVCVMILLSPMIFPSELWFHKDNALNQCGYELINKYRL